MNRRQCIEGVERALKLYAGKPVTVEIVFDDGLKVTRAALVVRAFTTPRAVVLVTAGPVRGEGGAGQIKPDLRRHTIVDATFDPVDAIWSFRCGPMLIRLEEYIAGNPFLEASRRDGDLLAAGHNAIRALIDAENGTEIKS